MLKAILSPPIGEGPSVTTIIGALAKPALINWAAKEERKLISLLAGEMYEKLALLVDEPVPKEKFIELLLEEAGKNAHYRLLAKASAVGAEVHKRIEWQLRGELNAKRDAVEPLLTNPQSERAWEHWKEWRKKVNLKPISIEMRVFSTVFDFGGALDLLAEVNGILTLIDFKTGKAVYAESFLQNVAYRLALLEEGIDAKAGIIVRLPKYIDEPEFEAVDVPDSEPLVTAFLALAVVYKWWDATKKERKKNAEQPKG